MGSGRSTSPSPVRSRAHDISAPMSSASRTEQTISPASPDRLCVRTADEAVDWEIAIGATGGSPR